ncbi:MAG: DUF2278 family protein [Myxococcota bacterium]
MALNYGVLKGRPIDRRFGSSTNNHYQIHIADENDDWRIAINVQSKDGSQVEYAVLRHFAHPITARLPELGQGFTRLPQAQKMGLDYIRSNLADPRDFRPLPASAPGPDNDLNELVDQFVQRAMAEEDAMVYAFGDRWGPENKKDKIFGFKPGNGIHDIHMNQGNSGQFANQNGVYQDGALLFHFPGENLWVAILLKFQTQAWHSDEATGAPLSPPTSGPPSDNTGSGDHHIGPFDLPTTDRPDGLVRIVAAFVNDTKSPEDETVTLLNTSPAAIDLAGWTLLDTAEHTLALSGVLAPGATVTVHVRPTLQLSNKGGLITLLNETGLKVHGVRYTKEKAQHPGWTITF